MVGAAARGRRLPRGRVGDADELREFLAPHFAKWWLPDRFEFVDEIPKTAVGKFRKTALREQFAAARAELVRDHEEDQLGTFVTTEHDGAVAVVTIDNPPMNALSAPLLEELEAEVDRLDGDDGDARDRAPRRRRARVRRGRRHQGVPGAARGRPEAKAVPARGLQTLGHRMDAARTPFVAAIHGFCLGGGLELAMCCDVRICADDAQLGQPEIKLGLIPGGGGTQRLPRLVGVGRANLLNLTGDFIDARTAYDWGLVERVVPREELLGTRIAVAARLRRALAARGRGDPRARAHDPRPLARGRAAPRGRRLPSLPPQRGRPRGRRGVRREARATVHRPVNAVVTGGASGIGARS